jgi:hypothetical protein
VLYVVQGHLTRLRVLRLVPSLTPKDADTYVGGSLSGFQSPYTPPSTQAQRVPPAPIFATPQRESNATQSPSSLQKKTSTPTTADGVARAPDTPKIGGKWIHPALKGIDKEARKFIFGEQELKRLIVNTALLYSMWWIVYKIEER